jgi:aminoglycoside/choline kinase family phosphotransferase
VIPRPPPEALLPWALSVLDASGGCSRPSLDAVAGDASSRRYFRFQYADQSYVAVEAPPATEKNEAFLAVRAILAAADVSVPALLGADLDRGFLLLEDLGDRVLLPELGADTADRHYRRAFSVLDKLMAVEPKRTGLAEYDRALLSEELGRFQEWFVRGLLEYSPTAKEQALLAAVSERLISSALEQPKTVVHRDFHSRNLMLLSDDTLAVIDFQDAVVGPITYDLVSLLRDCYIQWPSDQVIGWALAYREQLLARKTLAKIDQALFIRWLDWMGLQRHIKVLGTFARLYLRDGKSAYLDDLPLVVHYVQEIADKYAVEEPIFNEFSYWFSRRLGPLIAQQEWSRRP